MYTIPPIGSCSKRDQRLIFNHNTHYTTVTNSAAVHTKTTMKTAIIATLVGSAAAFAPAPVARVESSLSYAKELDSMAGVSNEVGGKVVCVCGRFL